MTRKHFEAIARIMRDHTPVQGEAVDITHRDTVDALADYFATENPNFDRGRFVAACGL
jgi:hypothetical protein